VVERMDKEFPDNQYTVAANFWEVDYYRDLGDFKKAEALLSAMNTRFGRKKDVKKDILYESAFIAFKRGQEQQALAQVSELLKLEPEGDIAARAAYLQGDIFSEIGDYAAAVNSYQACLKNLPGYELENACRGRLGDCNYSLYSKNHDDKYLDNAIAEYNVLSGRRNLSSSIRQQTLFKLGKCYEGKKDDEKAMEYYKELIFNYKTDSASGVYTRPVWLVKAAYAAIDIYMAQDTPEAAAAAVNVYNVLNGLNLNIGDDYRKIIEKIRRKFKL